MDFFRNKEVRLQIILYALITTAVSGFAFFFYRSFCWMAFLTSCTVSCISLFFTFQRYEKIASLSMDIDKLMHGEENIRFDDYKEGELAVLGNEISKMTLRLLEQSEQLRKDKEYLADSLADISHQLKTPLTSLEILNTALSQDGVGEEQKAALLQEQLMLLSRMEWLITVLLKLSRLDAGIIEFEKKNFSVQELVKLATSAFDISLDIKNITIDISDLPEINLCGDIKWIAEALSNIIKNCIENTPSGGKIKISAKENPMYVKICITDNGCGISKEDISHLFDRFYRGKIPARMEQESVCP